MTEAIKHITLLNIIFVILLIIAGSLGGIVGETVYYLAFALPALIGFRISCKLRYEREEKRGLAESPDGLLTFDTKRALLLLPLLVPAVMLVLIVSAVTSRLLAFVGVQAPIIEDTGILNMLLVHALIPAILEETLFRYIPMKLLMPYSRRWCVIYSALCFALIHCSLTQMPYAFIAGILFMMIDIAFGSLLPSVILHLLNNATSVISMKYCTDETSMMIFLCVMLALSAVSLLFILKRREEYKVLFASALDKGDSFTPTYAPLMLALICLYVAVASL